MRSPLRGKARAMKASQGGDCAGRFRVPVFQILAHQALGSRSPLRAWKLTSALLLVALVTACSGKPPALAPGEPVPGFALMSLSGETLRLPEDVSGRVVAVRFWADWCPFCKSEMQALEPVYQRLKEEGLVILAINVRQDRETAAAFIARLGTSYPVLLDTEGEVARQYGVLGLPTTFIVDQQGRLSSRIIGESTPEVFERAVRGAL